MTVGERNAAIREQLHLPATDLRPILVYSRMWRSGTGLYAQGVAKGIALAGHPTVFLAPQGEPHDSASDLPLVRRIKPPRELTQGSRRSRLYKSLVSLRRIAQALSSLLIEGARIRRVIVTIPDPLIFSLWPMLILRCIGCRIVFICHDPVPHAWRLPKCLQGLERGSHALSYRLASHIVVLASAGKTALTKLFGIDPQKIFVVPHGVFEIDSVGRIPRSHTLLLFGTLRRNKQIHLAIQGVALARKMGCDVTLHIAGGIDANDPDYVRECQHGADLYPEFIKLEASYISDQRMQALLQSCDAVLLPYTHFDSQSGVAVMAGMAGRPVIASTVGGIPDLVRTGLAAVEISSPTTAETIADAICEFYASSMETWDQKAVSGRAELSHALSWQTVGSQLAQLFS